MHASTMCEGTACRCHADERDAPAPALLSRRRLLRATIAGAATSVLASGIVLPSAARAQTTMSPAEALQALVAGNIATSEIIASIEYGAAVLGTKAIMVLGHGNCGAVKATMDGKAVPGQISALYRSIRPAVNAAGSDLRAATEANAKLQAQLLKESSPVLADLVKQGKLTVVAAFFDVAGGKVTLLS